MKRVVVVMWAWIIIVGGLLIYIGWIGPFPPEPQCIVCGRGLFLGLGAVSVVLGLGAALASRGGAFAR